MKSKSVSLRPRMRWYEMARAAILILPATTVLHAQTWTGAASHWWNDPANWKGGLPVSGPATVLTFGASTRLGPNNNLGNPFVLNTLFFDATAPTFQLSGSPLAFSENGQLLQNSAN